MRRAPWLAADHAYTCIYMSTVYMVFNHIDSRSKAGIGVLRIYLKLILHDTSCTINVACYLALCMFSTASVPELGLSTLKLDPVF